MKKSPMVSMFTALLFSAFAAPLLYAASTTFLDSLPNTTPLASTVPNNGDVNPYGVAVVPASVGSLVQGHVLVSNFNNRQNLQGTGTTITDIAPDGKAKVFAKLDAKKLPGPCPGGIGLTTALAVLHKGWVIVGSLPTADGTGATAQSGCLIVLDSHGHIAETLRGGINGPWDMTAVDAYDTAWLFVTNVLNGTVAGNGNIVDQGTVVRIQLSIPDEGPPALQSVTTIGSGFPERTDPAALVIGPTGVAISGSTLYVANTVDNSIDAIPDALSRTTSAGTGTLVSADQSFNGPLGMAIAPNGNILTVNAGDGNIVETTQAGNQVAVKGIDTSGQGAGTLFGLAVVPGGQGIYYVDDGDNTLDLIH